MYALHTPYSWYAVFLPPYRYIYIFGVSHNDTAFDTFAHLFFSSFKIFSPFIQYFFLCIFSDRILFGCRSVYFYRWTDPPKKPKRTANDNCLLFGSNHMECVPIECISQFHILTLEHSNSRTNGLRIGS